MQHAKNSKTQVSFSPYFDNYGDLFFPLQMNICASNTIPIFLVIIKTSSSKAIKTWTGRTPHPEQQKSNNRWGSHIRPRLLLTAGKTISPLRLNSKNCSPLQQLYKICQSSILTMNALSYQWIVLVTEPNTLLSTQACVSWPVVIIVSSPHPLLSLWEGIGSPSVLIIGSSHTIQTQSRHTLCFHFSKLWYLLLLLKFDDAWHCDWKLQEQSF